MQVVIVIVALNPKENASKNKVKSIKKKSCRRKSTWFN